jgi:hypothetical protein
MNKMAELKTTTALVETMLEQYKSCRNSNIYAMTIPDFLLHMNEMGFPPFESVRRSRQKIQAEYPELAASEAVTDKRALNESVFKEDATSKVGI